MSYICTKKLSLAGERYYPGNTIPDEAFAEGSAAKLIKAGYVTEASPFEGIVPPEPVEIVPPEGDEPVISVVFTEGEESLALPITSELLQSIVEIMQKTAVDAAAAISELSDETALVFIQKVDSRKTVKEAVTKRLVTLPTPDAPNGPSASQEVTGAETEDPNTQSQ